MVRKCSSHWPSRLSRGSSPSFPWFWWSCRRCCCRCGPRNKRVVFTFGKDLIMRAIKRFVVMVSLFSSTFVFAAASEYAVIKKLPIGGQGSWDYLTVDPQTHQLYVPRSTHTLVLDEAGKTIADMPGQKGAHGVAVVPQV